MSHHTLTSETRCLSKLVLVFREERVVIPQAMRGKILKKVHNLHLGVNGCLNRTRECLCQPAKHVGSIREISPKKRCAAMKCQANLGNVSEQIYSNLMAGNTTW